MRDQPHAWQHRSNDATESATGTMPTPREPADGDADGAVPSGDAAQIGNAAPTGDADGRTADDRTTGEHTADDRTTDERTADDSAADERAADERTTDDSAAGYSTTRDSGEPDEEPAAADAAAGREGGGELMPGDVPEQPARTLFDGSSADDFRDRWQRVQLRFVDDPRGAADEARVLTDDVVSALHDALDKRVGSLGGWQSGQAGDTEELRVAVRRYRDLLDRLLGL